MSIADANVSRRNFLRGVGVCIALPAFDSWHRLHSMAAEAGASNKLARTATGAPLRTAFVFFPNGSIPSAWWPTQTGTDFAFGATLQPLEPNRQSIQLVGGLDHLNARGGPDGAGDHARGNGVFLTGVRLKKSDTDIRAGISIDQAIARRIGHLTRFPSLELTCDAARKVAGCDSGYSCAYQYNLSWSSATTPVAAESNPRLVFERLFGFGSPGERAANLERRAQEQRSVLDFVLEDARSMQRRLATRDKDKLEQYLTGVREVENRIQQSERFGPVADPGIDTPSGIPTHYGEYVQLMFDLMVIAFQTDSTRIATFCLAHDGSNRSLTEIGIVEGHHDLSHHQNKPDRIEKVAQIDRWYAEQFAKFVQRLATEKDIDGNSLLHNSMVVYGGGNADGNRHSHTNLPIVLAGAGGGTLTPGRYIKHGSTPMSNLFLSLAERMGVEDLSSFGDSTGRLADV